jgi:hypothetical protein
VKVAVCPCCGTVIKDNPFWVSSKFDLNADYMRWEESLNQPELKEVCKELEFARNFQALVVGLVTYYRRGKGGKFLYRVPNEDFRVEVEKPKPKGKQLRLPVRVCKLTFDASSIKGEK